MYARYLQSTNLRQEAVNNYDFEVAKAGTNKRGILTQQGMNHIASMLGTEFETFTPTIFPAELHPTASASATVIISDISKVTLLRKKSWTPGLGILWVFGSTSLTSSSTHYCIIIFNDTQLVAHTQGTGAPNTIELKFLQSNHKACALNIQAYNNTNVSYDIMYLLDSDYIMLDTYNAFNIDVIDCQTGALFMCVPNKFTQIANSKLILAPLIQDVADDITFNNIYSTVYSNTGGQYSIVTIGTKVYGTLGAANANYDLLFIDLSVLEEEV